MNLIIRSVPLWAELVSLAFCIGMLVCRAWILSPGLLLAIPDHGKLLRRMWLLFRVSVAVILAGSAADLISRASEMSGRPIEDLFPLMPVIILKTHFGLLWISRVMALIVTFLLATVSGRYRNSPGLLYVLVGLAVLIAWTESATGHAADKGDFTAPELADWLHLLGATVWGGGLFVLSLIILPHLSVIGTEGLAAITSIGMYFSRIAGFAVGIIALTSLYQLWTYIGSAEALEKTPYGNLVIAKAVLFLLLVIFAALNRYAILPFLKALAGLSSRGNWISIRFFTHETSSPASQRKRRMAVLWFLRSMRIEAALMLVVLFCVALLRYENPASHFLHYDHSAGAGTRAGHSHGTASLAEKESGPIVSLETMPAEINAGSPVKMKVRIKDKDGTPLVGLVRHHERILHAVIVGQDLRTFAHIHPEDLGPVTKTMLAHAVFPLQFTFPKSGNYLVGLDFATADKLYSDTILISVMGGPSMAGPDIDLSRSKNIGTYRVLLISSPEQIRAGKETTLIWHIEQNGEPATDLQPYLGAPMHITVVSANLQHFMHIHGLLPGEVHGNLDRGHMAFHGRFGPDIESNVVFPAKGIYALFGQVSHEENVLLFEFMVEVR
jgi:putative copper resistance protein D